MWYNKVVLWDHIMSDFTRYNVRKKIDDLTYGDTRATNSLMFAVKAAVIILALLLFTAAISMGTGMLIGIVKNAPEVEELTFSPVGYASKTLDSEGNVTATLVQAGSNREEAKFEEFPEDLINAVVAVEDQRFWDHDGIDLRSITRAVKGVVSGDSSAGGGSTLTQQLVKNNVFGGGNEHGFALYERKFQEWYIALALENQPGKTKEETKKQIITDYLNTINLGNNCLGVKVAARRYFGKDLKDLTLEECAVLACIPKNPTRYNPITHADKNQERRLDVLEKMRSQGYITKEQEKKAAKTDVYDEIKTVNEKNGAVVTSVYSYFTDALIDEVVKALKEKYSFTDAQAKNMLYSGGLTIVTTQDPKIQKIVDEEVNDPENYDTAKYSYKWRMSVAHPDGTLTHYSERDVDRMVKAEKSSYNGLAKEQETLEGYVDAFKESVLQKTDEVIAETLDFTLEPQLSFVVMDHHTGEVKAICGGRGEKQYSLTINRAMNTLRQPGSTFKVLTAFAPAIEQSGATLGTPYYDCRYVLGEKEFHNWWTGGGFFGYSTIRDGIEFSMNIVAVRCLVETVGVNAGVQFARNMGISTLTDEDENPAAALGGLYNGVSNVELTDAFAAIANGGEFNSYRLFTKVYDHDGNLIIDNTEPKSKRVMKESTAYLLTDAMRMSTVAHAKWAENYTVNNTSSRSHLDNMICAGKSGTTTSNNDIWFVGFTPYYTAGVWAGCDENQTLYDASTGEYNGGTSFHKDIWNRIMTRIHAELADPGAFEKPDNIVEREICRKSGLLATDACRADIRSGAAGTYVEYFDASHMPDRTCDLHQEDGTLFIGEKDLERGVTDDTEVNAKRLLEASEAAENEGEETEGPLQVGPASQVWTGAAPENYDFSLGNR